MSDDFSEKQDIDKDFITHFSRNHATDLDDGVLLDDLLNEITVPEQAADKSPFKEGNNNTFLLLALFLTLLASGAVYSIINPNKADQKPAETTVARETQTAVIKSVLQMQPANKTQSESAVEQTSSAVIVNSELDSETVKRVGPPWALNLVSTTQKQAADKHVSTLRSAGYAAEVVGVTIKGTDWLRIRIPGFASVREANLVAAEMITYPDSWVGGQ